MTITVGDAATSGEKELRTSYPKTKGTTAGTTRQKGKKMNLIPKKSSLVPKRLKRGL
jgi:hypothetical protein